MKRALELRAAAAGFLIRRYPLSRSLLLGVIILSLEAFFYLEERLHLFSQTVLSARLASRTNRFVVQRMDGFMVDE